MRSSTLLTTVEQSYFYKVDEKVVYLTLHIEMPEEYPVVPFRISPNTAAEGHLVSFAQAFDRLSYINGPEENPMAEDGDWAKLDTSNPREVKKMFVDSVPDYYIARSNATGDAHVYWTQDYFSQDCEVAFQRIDQQVGAKLYIWLCVQNEGTSTPSGYRLEIESVSGSSDPWRIQRVDAGVVTTLATQNWSLFNWDWALFRRVGDKLQVYELYYTYDEELDIDADYPEIASDWLLPDYQDVGFARYTHWPIVGATDSTIQSNGRVGFGVNHLAGIRNFYAGDAYSNKQDEETVYLNLHTYGYEGIEGEPTFFTFGPGSLDQWEIYWSDPDENPQHHFGISSIVAVDGTTSLRCKMDGNYPISNNGFAMTWPDFVNGGDATMDYWMTYAFYIENWASIEQGGLGGSFPLPGIQMQEPYSQNESWGYAPYLTPLTETTGQVSFSGSSVAVADKTWHTVRFRWRQTGTQRVVKMYVNESVLYDATIADTFGTPPMGVGIGNENANTAGVVYIDAMTWSPGVEPTAPSVAAETGTGLSTNQWIRLGDYTNGSEGVYAYIDLWEYGEGAEIPEAWTYAEVYIPQQYLDQLPQNEYSAIFLDSDVVQFYVHKQVYVNPCKLECYAYGTSSPTNKVLIDPLEGNRWYRIETHYLSNTLTEVWIDDQHFSFPITSPGSVDDGLESWSANQAEYVGSTHSNRNLTAWFGFDNLAFDDRGRVNDQQFRYRWTFENKDVIEEANLNFPDPPFFAGIGPFGYETSIEEGGFGPGPGLPLGFVYLNFTITHEEEVSLTTFGEVYLDLEAVTGTLFLDEPTVYFDLQVLGGECYSTFTAEQFGTGEATLKWSTRNDPRWDDEEDLRWTGAPALADTIHC